MANKDNKGATSGQRADAKTQPRETNLDKALGFFGLKKPNLVTNEGAKGQFDALKTKDEKENE